MDKFTRITGKWWFYAILVVMQFVLLPVATRNFSPEASGDIIWATLANAFQVGMREYYLWFQITAIVMFVMLAALRGRMAKVFNIYVFVCYVVFAFVQNVAITEKYGLSIVTVNVIMFLLVAYAWLREILHPANDYSFRDLKWSNAWMIVLSVVAFWAPLSGSQFDPSPMRLLDSGSSLAFCLMTPAFLTIMTLNIPFVHIGPMSVSS